MLSRSYRRAFTLIELLVVVALIAIGAALLFPVFTRRDSHTPSNKSSCQNNLKQIALGFKQYINDFDEHYPLACVTDASGTTFTPPYGWADALQPYIKNTQVMQCPSDVNAGGDAASGLPNFTDYWYNANFVRKFPTGPSSYRWLGAKEEMLGSSSQTIIAGDGGNTNGTPTGDARYNQCGDGSSVSRRNQICAPQMRGLAQFPAAQMHLDGANFAFADGHVKWFKGINASQSAQVQNSAATQSTIGGNITFSLLNIP